jgi:TRAP-type transport system periplasmic protein
MKKSLIVLAVASLLLTGCGKNDQKTTESKISEPITLKVTTLSVPNDAHTKALNVFKDKVEEYSKGTIKAEVYHSASLFGAEEEFPALLTDITD